MTSFCGADCANCGYGKNGGCRGCAETAGCPFGKNCFITDYLKTGGAEQYKKFVETLVSEINALGVEGMKKIDTLYPMNGAYVNLAYPLPSGESVKFLDDREIYLSNQVEMEIDDGTCPRCYGIVANASMILVASYGENGCDPELVLYHRR